MLIFKSTETEGWKIILFSLFVKDKNTYWDFYCLLLPTNGHLYLVLWAAHTFLSTNFGIQLCSPTWKMTPSSHSHQQWAGSPFWAQNRGLNFDPIILVLKPRWLANRISPSLKPLKVHEDPETGSQKEALPGTSTEVVRQGCHMLFPDASKTESSKNQEPLAMACPMWKRAHPSDLLEETMATATVDQTVFRAAPTTSLSLSVLVCRCSGLGHPRQHKPWKYVFF